MTRRTIVLVTAVLVAVGLVVVVVWRPVDDEKMSDLAAALVPVSSAVDGYLNFSDAPADLNGEALLTEATQHNPKLIEPFADYVVLVRRDGLASSVLVCDKDREHALMEDAGCTGEKFDARLWEQTPQLTCDFQLVLQEVCKVN